MRGRESETEREKDKDSRERERESGKDPGKTEVEGWRRVYSVSSVEGWTKRGFKLPRFISINTTVLSYDEHRLSLLYPRGGPSPRLSRCQTTNNNGETNAGNTGGPLSLCARNLPISYLLSFFTREGGGEEEARIWRLDR